MDNNCISAELAEKGCMKATSIKMDMSPTPSKFNGWERYGPCNDFRCFGVWINIYSVNFSAYYSIFNLHLTLFIHQSYPLRLFYKPVSMCVFAFSIKNRDYYSHRFMCVWSHRRLSVQ